MARLQKAGHRPIAIFGGGTAMVGDPSGKTDMRKMLSKEQINSNIERFKYQMSRFIDISDGKALFINNADWLWNLNYIDFLRDIGPHFSVNRMLAAECYKQRMETGLTFLEFNYMIMQAYDFYRLNEEYDCKMQLGGDDQWSNIIAGVELIRRKTGREAIGLTFRLLLTSDGKKMGKTEKGAIWLDPEKTPPYDFFQYWRNVADADVIKCMKMLTFIPLDEIAEYEKLQGAELNKVKERLAYELTSVVHGKDEADSALQAARSLFGGAGATEDMPTTELSFDDFVDGKISIIDMLVKSKLASSRREARTLIVQGGVFYGDGKISEPNTFFDKENFAESIIIRKGKKSYHRFKLK